jgi:hypothetical protein
MERAATLREMISQHFDHIESTLATIAQTKDEARRAFLLEALQKAISESRAFCVTAAADQPGLHEDVVKDFLNSADDEQVASFVHGYLQKQVPLLAIAGADSHRLIEDCFSGILFMDPDAFESGIRRVAQEGIKQQPKIEAPDFAAEILETICREAVGLDGRIPAEEIDPYHVRRLLGRICILGRSPAF